MREYSFTEARQHFAAILEEAKKEGAVCIKKRDGETFYLKPASPKKSPLDVAGVDLGLSSAEIVELVRKGRDREYD
jgi:PHD/YefM family antitoxin component YafN of YafNO toxin-antitoxin module